MTRHRVTPHGEKIQYQVLSLPAFRFGNHASQAPSSDLSGVDGFFPALPHVHDRPELGDLIGHEGVDHIGRGPPMKMAIPRRYTSNAGPDLSSPVCVR